DPCQQQRRDAHRPENSTNACHLSLLVVRRKFFTRRCQGRAQTPELFIKHSVAQSATNCIDSTSVGWPRTTSRNIGAGIITSGSSLPLAPTATTETSYRSLPWVSGMLNGVDPVCLAQGKSHWALPAQGITAPAPASTTPPSSSATSVNLS